MTKHGEDQFDEEYYKRFFEKYSEKEFRMYCRWALGWVDFLGRYLPLKRGKRRRVLELGSSLGYFSRILADRGFDVTASDISSYIVKKAGKIQKDIKFVVIDAEKKMNVRGNFDYIVAFEVLEHLKNPEKAMKNIYAKLSSGGVLIFSTPFPTKRSLSDPTHINVHEKVWWFNAGKKAGFKKKKVVYGTFIPFLYRISKHFSKGVPLRTDLPLINSTAFFIFHKK